MACSLLFAGHVQIAMQGNRVSENGDKDSVQVFWLLFFVFESSHSSHQDKE